MSEKPGAEPEPVKTQEMIMGADSAPVLFANSIKVTVTPNELRLTFRIIEDANPERVLLREVASVFLTPSQGRALRDLLNRNAAMHEAAWSGRPKEEVLALKGKGDGDQG